MVLVLLHLRARGFAPLTTALRKLLMDLALLPYGQFAQLRGHWAR